MVSRKTHRIVNTLALIVGVSGFVFSFAFMVVLTMPWLAFGHSAGDGRITFHAAHPIPEAAARAAAADAWAALQDTPFGTPDHGIDVYIADRGWRHWIAFRAVPEAGGLTYPLLSRRNLFLSGVDFEAGRLTKNGVTVPPPRDLTYYLVHEITHLRHAEALGPVAMFRAPFWVREGVPDLAALGPATDELIALARAGADLPRAEYGSYPLERACVTLALSRPGMDMARLLALRVPMSDLNGCPSIPARESD